MKYIGAEKLIAEIKRRKQIHKSNIENGFPDEANKIPEDDDILSFIIFLQQEQDMGEVSDGYHTFNELYYYRMLYNAAFFNELAYEGENGTFDADYDVHKSKKHADGEECFGGGWFIVMAELPTGQISNHYEMKYWDLFNIPEKEVANKWDGHTPQEAAERLHKYLTVYKEVITDYKEKYNNALDWMRSVYPTLTGAAKEDAEHYFPELKESEDERIRKEIINYLNFAESHNLLRSADCGKKEEWIAYLEKQKEQIPYIDFVIKPHKGDDNNPYDMRVSEAQEYAINRGFGSPFNDGEVYVDERHMTQTIGNIIRWADEHPKEQKSVEYLDRDKIYDIMTKLINLSFSALIPINSKEYTKIDEITSDVRSLLDYPIEQKSAKWSEEDELMRNACIAFIQDEKFKGYERAYECVDWLKSLCPSWKPSDK